MFTVSLLYSGGQRDNEGKGGYQPSTPTHLKIEIFKSGISDFHFSHGVEFVTPLPHPYPATPHIVGTIISEFSTRRST